MNPARLLHPLTAQDNQRTALTNSVQTIFSAARTLGNVLAHCKVPSRLQWITILDDPSPCSPPNDRLVLHGPELQDANDTAMLFYTMARSVFLLACDVSRGTFIADVHVINGSNEVTQNFLSENMVRLPCLVLCYLHVHAFADSFCLIEAYSCCHEASTLQSGRTCATHDRWTSHPGRSRWILRQAATGLVCKLESIRLLYFQGHARCCTQSSGGRPRPAGLLRILLHMAISRLAHQRIPTTRQSTPERSTAGFPVGIA